MNDVSLEKDCLDANGAESSGPHLATAWHDGGPGSADPGPPRSQNPLRQL